MALMVQEPRRDEYRPKDPRGSPKPSQARRQRMASGGRMRALEGFYRWLEGGGREALSRLAKEREKRKRWRRVIREHTRRVGG